VVVILPPAGTGVGAAEAGADPRVPAQLSARGHDPPPRENASGADLKRFAFTSGRLCSNFREVGHVTLRKLHSHEVGYVILVQMFKTRHVIRILVFPHSCPHAGTPISGETYFSFI
jgi:hypothetical protein